MLDWKFQWDLSTLAFCTLISLIVNLIWYGPLFGELWLEYSLFYQRKKYGDDERKVFKFLVAIICNFLLTFIYASFIETLAISNYSDLALFDLLICVGYIFTNAMNSFIWEKATFQCILINLGYQMLQLFCQGTILLAVRSTTHFDDSNHHPINQGNIERYEEVPSFEHNTETYTNTYKYERIETHVYREENL